MATVQKTIQPVQQTTHSDRTWLQLYSKWYFNNRKHHTEFDLKYRKVAYYDIDFKDWVYFNADANAWYKKKDAKQYSKVQKKQKQNIRDTFKKNEDNLQTGQGTAANFPIEII